MTVLQTVIEQCLGTPPTEEVKPALVLIAKFTSRAIDSSTFNKATLSFSRGTRRGLKNYRRWAHASSYWASLWRAVVDPACLDASAVEPQDVILIRAFLPGAYRRMLKHKRHLVKRMGQEEFESLLAEITTCAKSYAWRKLRFITKYDPQWTQDDFINELVEVGIRVVRRYEDQGMERLQLLNYARRAIHNTTINFVMEYKRVKRARLVEGTCGDIWRTTTTSLEALPGGVEDKRVGPPVLVDPKVVAYSQAVVGLDPKFHKWIRHRCCLDPLKLSEDSLRVLARRWVGVSTQQIKHQFAELGIQP